MIRFFIVKMSVIIGLGIILGFHISPSTAQNTRSSRISHAEVRMYLGSPTMFVDGKPTAAMTYTIAGRVETLRRLENTQRVRKRDSEARVLSSHSLLPSLKAGYCLFLSRRTRNILGHSRCLQCCIQEGPSMWRLLLQALGHTYSLSILGI